MLKLKESFFLTVALIFASFLTLSLTGCLGQGGGGDVAVGAAHVNYYVDSATGSDSNDGTQATPFKTLTWAINAASAAAATRGADIHAASGVYNAASGEVFPLMPTKGENLIGSGTVLIQGAGNYTVVGGEASGTAISTSFAFAPGVKATLTGFSTSGVEPTVVVTDNARVTLADNQFVYALNSGQYVVWAVNGSVLHLTNNTIEGHVAVDTADASTQVIARGNHFDGEFTICTSDFYPTASQLDFGTAASPGNNTILRNGGGAAGVNNWGASGDTAVLTFVGNTWMANQQGADANGHYASQHIAGPATGGPNYHVQPTAGIQF